MWEGRTLGQKKKGIFSMPSVQQDLSRLHKMYLWRTSLFYETLVRVRVLRARVSRAFTSKKQEEGRLTNTTDRGGSAGTLVELQVKRRGRWPAQSLVWTVSLTISFGEGQQRKEGQRLRSLAANRHSRRTSYLREWLLCPSLSSLPPNNLWHLSLFDDDRKPTTKAVGE